MKKSDRGRYTRDEGYAPSDKISGYASKVVTSYTKFPPLAATAASVILK